MGSSSHDSLGFQPSTRRPAAAPPCRCRGVFVLLLLAGGGFAAPARADLSAGGPAKAGARNARPAQKLAKKGAKTVDEPFDTDAPAAKPAKGKGAGDSAAAGTPPARAKSGESLDNLMNDVVSDTKTAKPKRHDREMDDLLKDVQKTGPAPVAKKKEEAPPAPPLSPADISAAMAQVKIRGNACAQKFGRSGTAQLKITVSKEGRVTDVELGGKLAGTPVAGCIEQAVKTASFRPNAGLKFDYRMDVR
jgi:hypothetical protein